MSISRRALLAAPSLALLPAGLPLRAQSTTTIRVTYAYPQNYTAMKKEIIRRFEAEQPTIKVELLPAKADYEELVQDTLRQALIGQPLAEVGFHGLHRARLLVERGIVAPIDALIAAEADWSQRGFIPAMQRLGEVDGKNYALSFAVSTMVLHVNADLVAKAGADPDNLPKQWDGIIELAKKIKATSAEGIYWSYYDTANNWTFHSLLQSHGGQMMTPDNKTITFDSPAGMRSLQIARQFGEAGMIDMRDAQAVQSFSAGTLGLFVVSSSRIDGLGRAARGKFRYITTPLPRPVETANFPAGGSGVMVQTRDPAKQRAAWEFAKFCAGPIGQTVMVQNSGYMPGNDIPMKNPDMLGRFYEANPNHQAAISQLDRMTRFYAFPGENSLRIPDVIRDHLQTVVTLRRKPEDVMPDMVRDVQKLLPVS